MGIISCEEAKGREAMATKLANMPNMSVDDAKELLAAAPKASSNDSAAEAIAALTAEHGESLDSSASSEQATDSDEEQCASLLAAIGKKRD